MSNIGCLTWIINLFVRLSWRYRNICNDPERKQRTVYFGVYSIISSLISCAMFALCIWGFTACMAAMGGSIGDALLVVFMVILALLALVLIIEIIVGGIMGIIYQLRCNKRAIGWIALAVLILAVGATVAVLIYILGLTGIDW